ncbi:proheparin-binding EGF-like growth factor [Myxocyprinus asiaticus]|uniref:proheparin-binding EGF-like growth factor n=1 Tax=Myxocyprinus asiaticus TaxID=70543 RepID=UPI0022218063|nr:proheparin-binding EGF-like growth factor [Myxocyprinus asiaticus]
MDTLRLGVVFVHCVVLLKVCSSASMDRYESDKPRTTVVNLFHTFEETRKAGHREVDRGSHLDESDLDDDYFSGDYELNQPRVAFSTKPKHPSMMPITENNTKGRRKGKRKGKGRKKNPCLWEYKDFCIHGVCQYLRDLRAHSCVCEAGYSGERCHLFTLSVAKREQRYNRTTALAVIAVVLSLLCLSIIGILLALRYHKKGDIEAKREEKVKLETTSVRQ